MSQHFRFPQTSLENGLLNYYKEEQIVWGWGKQMEEMKEVGVGGVRKEGTNFSLSLGCKDTPYLTPTPTPTPSVNIASLIEFGWRDFAIPGMPAANQAHSDPAVSAS